MNVSAPTIDELKEAVRREWTDAEMVAAWQKWHAHLDAQTEPATRAILQAAGLEPGMRVLDLATGAGEPALSAARSVAPGGQVVATDLSEGLLAIAKDEAGKAGLTNLSFQPADAHALPFPDGSFDRVTCRYGVMYFADIGQALREIRRVLKPEGRVAFVAIGDPQDFLWAGVVMGALMKWTTPPAPPPGAPQPFRFAEPGSLRRELEAAGFRAVDERHEKHRNPFPGTPEECWQMFLDLAPPFRQLLGALTPQQREELGAEVVGGYRRLYDGTCVNLAASIVVAAGTR